MAEAALNPSRRRSFSTPFFFWMTVGMAAFVFTGFGVTYLQPMVSGTLRSTPPIVHVHGMFCFTWLILLVVQSALINTHRVALHRSLGMLGIAIASAVVILGVQLSLLFARMQVASSDPSAYALLYFNLGGLLVFTLLFVLAITNLHQPDVHRRLVLLASLILIGEAANRIYDALFAQDFNYLLLYLSIDVLILVMLVYDWRTLGRIHPATLVGAGVNLALQVLHLPVTRSDWLVSVTHTLAGMARY